MLKLCQNHRQVTPSHGIWVRDSWNHRSTQIDQRAESVLIFVHLWLKNFFATNRTHLSVSSEDSMNHEPYSPQNSRREFLRKSAAAAGAIACFPWSRPALAFESRNDRLNIGAIGLGGRGSGDIASQRKFGDILAVCDVDLRHAEAAKATQRLGRVKRMFIRTIVGCSTVVTWM